MVETTYFWYRTPIGFITIAADGNAITRILFGCETLRGATKKATPLTTAASTEILEYLSHKRKTFTFPIKLAGTEFQLQVWKALQAIPYGDALTTTQVAERIGSPQAYRSVGAAIKANPLVLVIPDHRIVSAQGKAMGATKEAEKRGLLLQFEQQATKDK